jgi:hypothetical protein
VQEFGGGSGIFTNCSAMISTTPGTFHLSRHDSITPVNGDPADAAPNGFTDPQAAFDSFRRLFFSDTKLGWGKIRGMPRWNFDFGVAKTTKISERLAVRFDAQFFNIFNHPLLSEPGYLSGDLDLSTDSAFGSIGTSQFNSPRFVQFGLRFDF